MLRTRSAPRPQGGTTSLRLRTIRLQLEVTGIERRAPAPTPSQALRLSKGTKPLPEGTRHVVSIHSEDVDVERATGEVQGVEA